MMITRTKNCIIRSWRFGIYGKTKSISILLNYKQKRPRIKENRYYGNKNMNATKRNKVIFLLANFNRTSDRYTKESGDFWCDGEWLIEAWSAGASIFNRNHHLNAPGEFPNAKQARRRITSEISTTASYPIVSVLALRKNIQQAVQVVGTR